MHAYDDIFSEKSDNGIIERGPLDEIAEETGQVHYHPRGPVIRNNKQTTKIRAVFDASCKVNGPSLNECLYSGPNLIAKIFDILLRFRLNKIGVLADIKQAFLNVGIAAQHRGYLRFLWYDLQAEDEQVVIYRRLRVVFGITSSPFLLNETVRHSDCNSCKNHSHSTSGGAQLLQDFNLHLGSLGSMKLCKQSIFRNCWYIILVKLAMTQ